MCYSILRSNLCIRISCRLRFGLFWPCLRLSIGKGCKDAIYDPLFDLLRVFCTARAPRGLRQSWPEILGFSPKNMWDFSRRIVKNPTCSNVYNHNCLHFWHRKINTTRHCWISNLYGSLLLVCLAARVLRLRPRAKGNFMAHEKQKVEAMACSPTDQSQVASCSTDKSLKVPCLLASLPLCVFVLVRVWCISDCLICWFADRSIDWLPSVTYFLRRTYSY